jgi:predicted nucleic acid-binding protein
MTRYVIDASVAVKWFVPFKAEEDHLNEALQLLELFLNSEIGCYQPPHFIAEMIAVLTRLCPQQAVANVHDLLNMDFRYLETTEVYATACELSLSLKHHTFDTLYHAVALNTPGAILITEDEVYFRKAHSLGQIVRLRDYAN